MKNRIVCLLIVVMLALTACSSDKPFIANEGGDNPTIEETVNNADSGVKQFFEQAKPVISTVVTSLSEIGNTIFSVLPGIGINTDKVEEHRQEIQGGGQ